MILWTFKKVRINMKRNIATPSITIKTKQTPTILTPVFCLLNHINGVLFILDLFFMVFSPFNMVPHFSQTIAECLFFSLHLGQLLVIIPPYLILIIKIFYPILSILR
jgi:hypothetical protein